MVNSTLCILPQLKKKERELIKIGLNLININYWVRNILNPSSNSLLLFSSFKNQFKLGTALVVQGWDSALPLQGALAWSLVGELRSHMLCSQRKKQKSIQALLVIFVEKNWCAIGNKWIYCSDQFHKTEEPNILGVANIHLEKEVESTNTPHFIVLHFFIIIIFVMVVCDQWSLMLLLQLFWGTTNHAHITWQIW